MAGIGAVLAGLTAWYILAIVVGMWSAMTIIERSIKRDFPDGFLNAFPDPAELAAMFTNKKD
jgi:hypothetical protein